MDTQQPVFKVYVAGAGAESERARVVAVIAALRASGITVTNTWLESIERVGSSNPRDALAVDRRHWSLTCLDEIDASDALLFLVPDVATRGAWVELGHAHANNKHLVFAGDTKQSIFCALGIEFESDAAAIAYVRDLADLAAGRELGEREAMPFDTSDVGGEG